MTKNIGKFNTLFTYLENGLIECSNNLIEREGVRPFTINRKNFLFCKTNTTADNTAILFSIVKTAKANALNVEGYLEYLLENINSSNIDDLLPWSDKIPESLKIKLGK